jgi:hypothetical protein
MQVFFLQLQLSSPYSDKSSHTGLQNLNRVASLSFLTAIVIIMTDLLHSFIMHKCYYALCGGFYFVFHYPYFIRCKHSYHVNYAKSQCGLIHGGTVCVIRRIVKGRLATSLYASTSYCFWCLRNESNI